MSTLFSPFTNGGVTLANRIVVSPMCQYSSEDGFANDWHLVHLGARATGGAGAVLTEAAAVTADGRISPSDLGIYRDEHVEQLARITAFIAANGAVPGIQLAHAGRKASTAPPWIGGGAVDVANGGWRPIVAPSPIAFSDSSIVPSELTTEAIAGVVAAFAAAAKRADAAGFRIAELHAAHGYLFHEFLSPLSNTRSDAYGGSFDNRIRALIEAVDAVRAVWPATNALWVRISATDWVDGGWTIDESIALARILREHRVDLVDASSGGSVPNATIPVGPGYQVPFAARIRSEAAIATGAVGMITKPEQAEAIIAEGEADVVLLARELLRQPTWPQHAARELGVDLAWPQQYERAKPRLPVAAR